MADVNITYSVDFDSIGEEIQRRINRADGSDCYITEDGDLVLVAGAEEFDSLVGLNRIN